MIPLARRLEVIDLDRDTGLFADPDRLIDPLEHLIRFRPHVGDVHAAVRRHRLADLDQFLGRGKVAGRVDQRRRNPEGAVFHGPPHRLAHRVERRGIGRAHRFAHAVDANGRGTDEGTDIGGRSIGHHCVEPAPEPAFALERLRELLERGVDDIGAGERLGVGRRVGRAFAHDLGRDALRHFTDDPSVAAKQRAPRMALDVDEARRHHHATRVEAVGGIGLRQRPRRRNPGNPVAPNGDITIEPRSPGAVDHSAAFDDQIVIAAAGFGGLPGWLTGRDREQRDQGRYHGGAKGGHRTETPGM